MTRSYPDDLEFETKMVLVLREDLVGWTKVTVTAFYESGIYRDSCQMMAHATQTPWVLLHR